MKKLLIAVLACSLAFCTLTACGKSTNTQPIDALNTARASMGYSELKENEKLCEIAAEELDAYISWQVTGEITTEEYYARRAVISYDIEHLKIGGKTAYLVELEHKTYQGSGSWCFTVADPIVYQSASYAGCAFKAVNGVIYCTVLTADTNSAAGSNASSGAASTDALVSRVNKALEASGKTIRITYDASLKTKAEYATQKTADILANKLSFDSNEAYIRYLGLDPAREDVVLAENTTFAEQAKSIAEQLPHIFSEHSGSATASFCYTTVTITYKNGQTTNRLLGVVHFAN